jgi:hypothetical protein
MSLLPINTRVTHFGGGDGTHGVGTIVAYNTREPNRYLQEKPHEAIRLADEAGLLSALVSSTYDGQRYPYVVRWDNGYSDVYAPTDLQQVVTQTDKETS